MIISFFIGLFLGVIYFGGLYYSTQKFKDIKNPTLFMAFSFFIRMMFLVGGLYFLAKSGYKNILIGFLGLMLVRFIMVFRVKQLNSKPNTGRE